MEKVSTKEGYVSGYKRTISVTGVRERSSAGYKSEGNSYP